jgi:hypothetical protein
MLLSDIMLEDASAAATASSRAINERKPSNFGGVLIILTVVDRSCLVAELLSQAAAR